MQVPLVSSREVAFLLYRPRYYVATLPNEVYAEDTYIAPDRRF